MGHAERRRLPFEAHRAAEFLLGCVLVSVALHLTGSLAVLLAGLALLLPPLITRGRLGVVRWCSPRAHRWLDLVLVVALAALPLLPAAGGAQVAAFLEPTAAVLLLLSVRTDYTTRRRAPALAPASPAPGPDPSAPAAAASGAPLVEVAARRLGRFAGLVERAARAAAARDQR